MVTKKGPKPLSLCELLILTLLASQMAIVWVIQLSHESQLTQSTFATRLNHADFIEIKARDSDPGPVGEVNVSRDKDTTALSATALNPSQDGSNNFIEIASLGITAIASETNNETLIVDETVLSKMPNPTIDMDFTANWKPNLWDESHSLPQWMKDYFAWHRHHRSMITPNNWKQYRYCVMRCLDRDKKCGGTADRIKPVPLVLYWAARTHRIFLIHWSRPAPLEAFLLPPEGGIDWRVPDWLARHVTLGGAVSDVKHLPTKFLNKSGEIAVRTRLQSYNGGSLFYNTYVQGPRFETIYHDVWQTLFTPSLPLQAIIQEHLDRLDLRPGEYAGAHVRALYATDRRHVKLLHRIAENALNCASNLRPEGPFFFASDSKGVIDYVVGSLAQQKETKVVAVQRDYEPLHLEKSENWQNRSAAEYYDTFVDLYLLALSRCVTFNVGGYGEWSLWMSRNASCFVRHGKPKEMVLRCNWTGIANTVKMKPAMEKPVFRRPMEDITLTQ